jgi:hypothetical protein
MLVPVVTVVETGVHVKVKGDAPVATTVAAPVLPPKQLTL